MYKACCLLTGIVLVIFGQMRSSMAQVASPELAQAAQDELLRLRDVNVQIGNPAIFRDRPEQAIEAVKLLPGLQHDSERIKKKFGPLLQQRAQPYKDLGSTLRLFEQRLGAFETAVNDFAQGAPAAIDGDITEALRMAEQAVSEKHPLYFGPEGGVAQRLSWATTKLEVLSAIDSKSDAARQAAEELTDARKKVQTLQAALRGDIIAANQVPPDRYQGDDRAALLELLRKKWVDDGTGQDILKVGINGQQWEEKIRWTWVSDAWEKSDLSHLQGYVMVRLDDKIAVRHTINLVKDHLAGDRVDGHFLNDPKKDADISDQILLSKIK